jgi:hypothetical protein
MRLFRSVKYTFKNAYYFGPFLFKWRPWDYSYTLELFAKCLDVMSDHTEKWSAVWEDCKQPPERVLRMREASELIRRILDGNEISMAERELGEIRVGIIDRIDENFSKEDGEHDSRVYERSREIEQCWWDRLGDILFGENYDDGENIRSWWY